MADATHISLKVKLDEDIRRFSVQKDISFADLHSLISKHFVLAPENVQIKYIDDEEELITLGSDLELQEAKRLQPTVLRLNVYDVKSRRTPSDQPLPQLMALFVRDVTVPDGTSVTANVKFQKVWRVKNTGTATWPKGGVVLKMVDPKDDQLRVLAVGTITRAVGPDEETDIGVELQAPSRPGRCVQYWRLFAEDGSAFGSRLWVDITVVQDNAAAEKELAEQEEARRLAEQEEQLRRAMAEQLRLQLEEERKREKEEAAALRKMQEEAEQLRREEEEEKARLEEELVRQMEELKRQLEEDERRKREEEEAAAAAEAEAAAALKKKQQQEEEDAKKRQEEAQAAAAALKKKQQEEEEAKKRQAEAAAALKKQKEEEAAAAALRKKQEEEEAKKRQLCSKYPGQLTALAEMGFTNVEHNVKLLDKHKGSLDLALEALLSGH